MAIIVDRTHSPLALKIEIVGVRDIESFKELVQRGSNLWPDASHGIKEFADIVTNGKILQDYVSQDTSKKL